MPKNPADPTLRALALPTNELVSKLRDEIRRGNLQRGDRLLPEREMAQHFGVSRARLRQGLNELETQGLLFRRRGQGTFVQPPPSTDAMRLKSLAERVSMQEVMEVRLEIEPALAGLAASRADDQARRNFALAAEATQNTKGQTEYDAADDIFHYLIAEMAQNTLFLTIYESIRSVRTQASWTQQRAMHYSNDITSELGRQHQVLTAAILGEDSFAATEAMRSHLRFVARILNF